jgi:hypothetical protein
VAPAAWCGLRCAAAAPRPLLVRGSATRRPRARSEAPDLTLTDSKAELRTLLREEASRPTGRRTDAPLLRGWPGTAEPAPGVRLTPEPIRSLPGSIPSGAVWLSGFSKIAADVLLLILRRPGFPPHAFRFTASGRGCQAFPAAEGGGVSLGFRPLAPEANVSAVPPPRTVTGGGYINRRVALIPPET